jgi:hypothetical protein
MKIRHDKVTDYLLIFLLLTFTLDFAIVLPNLNASESLRV